MVAGAEPGIRLVVEDDGSGRAGGYAKKPGLGLQIMRHRAAMIGGSLVAQNQAGGGAAGICTVPAPDAVSGP
jgi:signal transduction histidine kinase